jgi:hypothetical protein
MRRVHVSRHGRVKMAANLVLDDAEVADGWTLACQSYPTTETVEIEVA